ncbi:Sperm-tail_PG-rich repeat [Hexamita inflata]|uniref:Sperm-tail PG-rich repeat n=1 Tax=Hexamita inflata TaxID=28002 RepID=A0AA86N9P3_9EUKA|nr:Sperm-tail PG-rich repeat [Hexamita inflata]
MDLRYSQLAAPKFRVPQREQVNKLFETNTMVSLSDSITPGPGRYNNSLNNSIESKSKYQFQPRRYQDNVVQYDDYEPGPGSYQISERPRSSGFSFGRRYETYADAERRKASALGPGAYEVNKSTLKQSKLGKLYEPYNTRPHSAPKQPGAADYSVYKGVQLQQKRAPEFSLSKSQRPVQTVTKEKLIGPGFTYSKQYSSITKSGAGGFPKQIWSGKGAEGPGPAAYSINVQKGKIKGGYMGTRAKGITL